jgi:hypothetical protein
MVVDPAVSYKDRQAVLRHVFGSHEAYWAIHKDGWYDEKFSTVLGALGFCDVRIEKSAWKATHNITVMPNRLCVSCVSFVLLVFLSLIRWAKPEAS